MSAEGQHFYPGEAATPSQIVDLADEYHRAAQALRPTGRRGQPLSRAPYRLVAIHAVELYLNAFLLSAGHPSMGLRKLHHDLAARTRFALGANLRLRKKTIEHLCSLSQTREYLTVRYDPGAPAGSELTRLAATLRDVSTKVIGSIRRGAARKSHGGPGQPAPGGSISA